MDKRDRVLNKKKNGFIYVVIIAVLVCIIGFLLIPKKDSDTQSTKRVEPKSTENSRYKNVKDKDGILTFPLSSFTDKVQYFEYELPESKVRFFILKSNDGEIRAAFDACDVCFGSRRGYNQVGDSMRCNNCGQTFPEDKINVVLGGCNPSPLNREIVGDNLVIRVDDIKLGSRFF